MQWSSLVVLSLAGLPLGYLLAQRWPVLCRTADGSGSVVPARPAAPAAPAPLDAGEPLDSVPAATEASPLPSEYLARWTIDYDAGDTRVSTRTVRVLRVQHRLMGLMCYCEDTHHIRNFAWQGLRSVREPETGRPVDFAAWVSAPTA
jgi:hypothetical protein